VTFIDKGPSGVDDFAKKRETKLFGLLKLHMFHSGDAPHEAVIAWIDDLERRASAYEHRKGVLYLIRDMLTFEASKRLHAREVSGRLFLLAQRITYDAITNRLGMLLPNAEWSFSNGVSECNTRDSGFGLKQQALMGYPQMAKGRAGFAKAACKFTSTKYDASYKTFVAISHSKPNYMI
jgi:hypothetical protein